MEINATKEQIWELISGDVMPYILSGQKLPREVIDEIANKVKEKYCD
jgi:hypothetical protein